MTRSRRTVFIAALLCALTALLIDAYFITLNHPTPSYLVLDRQQRYIADIGDEATGYGYWPLRELPPRVVAAALAIEDKRFWSHPGIDPLAVARAISSNARRGTRVSGASTLAMQLARMQDPAPRTYFNKLREAWRATVLTLRYGHEAVLKGYLRVVPYGNRIHGIAYAARRYLDKPVADLSWAEVAFLSALPQAPSLMNPYREDGRQRAIARGARILQALQAQGVLNAADYEMARTQLAALRIAPLPARSAEMLHAAFKLREVLTATPAAPTTPEPYRIVTTLDLDAQHRVNTLTMDALVRWDAQGADNAAVILVDRATHGIVAWLGSSDYFDKPHAGAIDYARVPRSPGSVLKPFFYALALERGDITPATILDDLPSEVSGVANSDRAYLGPLLPRQALANSRNVPAAALLNRIGLDEGYALLRDLKLHDDAHPARYYGLGLVIGAMPTTLDTVVNAYTALADDGAWRPLQWYVGQAQPPPHRVFSAATARIVTLFLADPAARLPTFPRMGATEYPFPVALKTGTSQGLRDAWTVAYSTRYLVGVWVGNADARPMRDITGGASAADLAQHILLDLHHDERQGLADHTFPPPPGYTPTRLCARTGKRATAACELVFEEWFAPGHAPVEDDDAHVRVAVDRRNGLRAQQRTPHEYIETRSFVNLPPRYAEWAAGSGLAPPPQDVSRLGSGAEQMNALHVSTARTSVTLNPASPVQLRIIAPHDGAHVLRDPSVPAAMSTLALRVEVNPRVSEVLWLVDGKPYAVAPYPYTLRWPLTPGAHTLEARLPWRAEKSERVRVEVD